MCVLCEIKCVMLHGVVHAACCVLVCLGSIMLNPCLSFGDSLCDAVGHVLCACVRYG